MTRLQPIHDVDLHEVCAFLNRTLNPNLPVSAWMSAFRHSWCAEKPNNGFMLLDQGRIVGVLGAIYSDQVIRGRTERFCNLTSWSVLEEFRSESMSLMREVLAQKEFHFTSFTPNPALVGLYRGLRFVPLDARQWMVPCLPWPWVRNDVVQTDPDQIRRGVKAEAAEILQDHSDLPGLVGITLGSHGSRALVLYRKRRRKNHMSVEILYLSDGEVFLRDHRALARHLFFKERALSFTVDARFLPRRPFPALGMAGPQVRLFLSKTLSANDIALLYSEVVAFDV